MTDLIPVVFERNGTIFANSRDVAAFFEKSHKDVLEATDNLLKSLVAEKSATLFIKHLEFNAAANKETRHFDLTKDGFTLLAMGFTGPKALAFKLRYIDRFNAMETALRGSVALPDLSDPKVLQQLLADHVGKRIEAERRAAAAERVAEAAKDTVHAFDRISNAEGTMSITEAAKALQCERIKDLFQWLHANGWIYRRAGNKNWLAHQDRIREGLLVHKVTTVTDSATNEDRVVEQVRITPAGLARLAKRLNPALIGRPEKKGAAAPTVSQEGRA